MPNENQSKPGQTGSSHVVPPSAAEQIAHRSLMKMAFLVEGGLFGLGLAIAYVGFFDRTQPLNAIDARQWRTAGIWGGMGTIPMLLYLAVYHFYSPRVLRPMREFVEVHLKPLFQQCSIMELVVISLLAGFCEELFFRWCLQGGISWISQSLVAGLLVASVVFGLCHWVNRSYGITTTLIGIYLGWLMVWTGTWLAPAIAHALFDFVALVYIARFEGGAGNAREPTGLCDESDTCAE
jgi:membrane protease YdiL (CAAX protease family)